MSSLRFGICVIAVLLLPNSLSSLHSAAAPPRLLQSGGTALGNLAASMPPGEWRQLPTNGFTQGLMEPCLDGANVFEYADSANWDPISRQWLFLGSTHGNCLLAKFVVYSDANNTWRSEPLPPDPEIKGPFHAYHHNTINPSTGDLYYRHATQSRFWKYSTNGSRTWTELRSIPAPRGVLGCCGALEFFPERNGVLYVDGSEGIFWFSAATNTWQRIANTALAIDSNVPTYAMGTYENFAEYNPVYHVIIFGGGREQPRTFYKMDSSGVITRMKNAPADVFAGTIDSLSTVDPVSGNYLAFLPSGAFYEYNVATDTWRQMPGTHPLKDGSGNYFEVAESPVSHYGVNMFVMHNPPAVWLYKHSSGGTQPSASSDFSARCQAPGVVKCVWSANQWMTFQVHVTIGPRVNDEFVSSVQLWIAREGQPSELAIDWGPYNSSLVTTHSQSISEN